MHSNFRPASYLSTGYVTYEVVEIKMDKDWEDIVESQEEKALFRALADEKWDWRTIDTLVRESGMSEKGVRRTLEKYKKFIMKSSIPDKSGNELHTLRSRYIKRQSSLKKALSFISKKPLL